MSHFRRINNPSGQTANPPNCVAGHPSRVPHTHPAFIDFYPQWIVTEGFAPHGLYAYRDGNPEPTFIGGMDEKGIECLKASIRERDKEAELRAQEQVDVEDGRHDCNDGAYPCSSDS